MPPFGGWKLQEANGMDISFTKLSSKGQITLPKAVRSAARLAKGDPVKIEVTEDGTIILRPQRMIDASQAWFFTPEWQDGEAAASADVAAGRTKVYKSSEDFLASLDD
jgi:AbrB family looped-hinge helix DNA binding protein